MKKMAVLFGILTVAGLAIAGCGTVFAHGTPTTETYNLTGFTGVDISSAFSYEITRANGYSISVTSEDFDHIVVENEGNTLKIYRRGVDWTPFYYRPTVKITMPTLTELTVSGASEGVATGFSGGSFKLDVSGASKLELTSINTTGLTGRISGTSRVTGTVTVAGATDLDISGASRADLSGSGQGLKLNVNGASRTELGEFTAETGEVSYNGASSGTINLSSRLDATVSGASSLNLRGAAVIGRLDTTGSSSFHRK